MHFMQLIESSSVLQDVSLRTPDVKQTFGDWLRWTVARMDIERPELAKRIGCSNSTITNLYRRADPEGVNDVYLSRLAQFLGMTEPELMTKWRDGLPPVDEKPAKTAKRKG